MSTAVPKIGPIGSAAEGEALMKHLMEVMDALLDMVEQETKLVRAGKLAEAATLEPAKAELSAAYLADATRIETDDIESIEHLVG